jgi:hypothetical protein
MRVLETAKHSLSPGAVPTLGTHISRRTSTKSVRSGSTSLPRVPRCPLRCHCRLRVQSWTTKPNKPPNFFISFFQDILRLGSCSGTPKECEKQAPNFFHRKIRDGQNFGRFFRLVREKWDPRHMLQTPCTPVASLRSSSLVSATQLYITYSL